MGVSKTSESVKCEFGAFSFPGKLSCSMGVDIMRDELANVFGERGEEDDAGLFWMSQHFCGATIDIELRFDVSDKKSKDPDQKPLTSADGTKLSDLVFKATATVGSFSTKPESVHATLSIKVGDNVDEVIRDLPRFSGKRGQIRVSLVAA